MPDPGQFCVEGRNWTATAYDANNDMQGAMAGTDDPPGDAHLQASYPGMTIKVVVERRLYDESMIEYTVIETEERTIYP